MTAKLPFMPFYGADFFESETVRLMNRVERSMYLELLWHQWREGSLPEQAVLVARLLGEVDIDEYLLAQFPVGEDQRRRNPRLETIRAEQEAVRAKKSEGGKAGRARQLSQGVPQGEPGDSPGSARGVLGQSESESEPDNNNNDDSARARDARWEQLAAGMDDPGQSALEGFRRASHSPDRLLTELESVVSGLHGPGGRAVPVPTLGRALHEMALGDAPMRGKVLQAFVRRAMEPDEPPRNGQKPEGDLSAWVARKEAERARADARPHDN